MWMWALLAQVTLKGQGSLRDWIFRCPGHPLDTAASENAPEQRLEVELETFPGQSQVQQDRA